MLKNLSFTGVLGVILFFIQMSITNFSQAQSKASIAGDYPDPSIIYANGKYYAVGTSSEWAPHLPIFSSKDLREWKQEGFVFDKTPEWVESSFWAPEYFYHNGLYYMYYSAKRKSDGISCIGVAVSKYPDREFIDKGIVVAYGTESIDAYVIQEGEDLYMTWKAYGLDKRPIELLGSKLSHDGLQLEGEPFSLLLDTARIGIEGQSFVKKDGYYYMFYSAGACCGPGCDYHVQAVRSKSLRGPYEDIGETVLLGNNEDWKCMGHGTFVQDEKGDYYYLFHGYSKKDHVYTGREGLMAKLLWSDQGDPVFEFIPKQSNNRGNGFSFDFRKMKKSEIFAQWDFRYSEPRWDLNQTGLVLSGKSIGDNKIGTVLTWKPESKKYEIISKIDLVKSAPNALKGVVIYGDVNKGIGVGVQNNQLQIWQAEEGKFNILNKIDLPKISQIELKIQTEEDFSIQVNYRIGSTDWKSITGLDKGSFSIKNLAPWDRSPRPGIHVKEDEDEKAVFQTFEIKY